MKHILVYITTPSAQSARDLAKILVQERLVAGVNVFGPIWSCFHWEQSMREADEWVCLCKTTESRFQALENRVSALHPYTTPCIVAVPIVQGKQSFLDWVTAETVIS